MCCWHCWCYFSSLLIVAKPPYSHVLLVCGVKCSLLNTIVCVGLVEHASWTNLMVDGNGSWFGYGWCRLVQLLLQSASWSRKMAGRIFGEDKVANMAGRLWLSPHAISYAMQRQNDATVHAFMVILS
jgi:hypothetical protein